MKCQNIQNNKIQIKGVITSGIDKIFYNFSEFFFFFLNWKTNYVEKMK